MKFDPQNFPHMFPHREGPPGSLFVAPDELLRIYARPGVLNGGIGQRARSLYTAAGYNFNPLRDLSKFGLYCDVGFYEGVLEEFSRQKPDLNGTETEYKWSYVALAAEGSRRERVVGTNSDPSSHAAIIRFLVTQGYPTDLPDIAGLTALHMVAQCNRDGEVLRTLLELGANPNHRDRYGTTALHSAVMNGQKEAVELLLKHGADPDACCGDGISPSMILRFAGSEISAIFQKYKRQKAKVVAPMQDKDECAACGKKAKSQCARCRVVRYCGPQCQTTHWKTGHKLACIPFTDENTSIVFKPTFGGMQVIPHKLKEARTLLLDSRDGEGQRSQDKLNQGLDPSRRAGSKNSKPQSTDIVQFDPRLIGKSMIIKVQIPTPSGVALPGPEITRERIEEYGVPAEEAERFWDLINQNKSSAAAKEGPNYILVYNKTREFTCQIYSEGQKQLYAQLEAIVKNEGAMGLKGYFVAELEAQDRLRIKTQILAEQKW